MRTAIANANWVAKIADHMKPKMGLLPLEPPPPKLRGDHGTGLRRVTSPIEVRDGNNAVAEKTVNSPAATTPLEANCTTSVSVAMALCMLSSTEAARLMALTGSAAGGCAW